MNVPGNPELQTERLRLRAPRLEDADAIFAAYATDPEVTRYMLWAPHTDTGVTREFLERLRTDVGEGRTVPWVIEIRPAGELAGMIDLRGTDHQREVGYVLARAHWGRGLMTEAVAAVARWGLAQPGVYRVFAAVDVENIASARVLEKAGFLREGVLRRFAAHGNRSPEPRDAVLYAVVR